MKNNFTDMEENYQNYLNKIVSQPRIIPYNVRKRIAEILSKELQEGELYEIKDWKVFVKSLKSFALILTQLHMSQEWQELVELVKNNDILVTIVLKELIPLIYDILEDPSLSKINDEINTLYKNTVKRLQKLILESLLLWGRAINDFHPLLMEDLYSIIENELEHNGYLHYLLQNIVDTKEHLVEDNGSKEEKRSVTEEINRAETLTKEISELSTDPAITKVLDEMLLKKITELMKWIQENKMVLEIIMMLYPGRLWDFSKRELHKEYFYNLTKYAKLLEKVPELTRIAELLGRIEFEEGQKRLKITRNATSEIYSVKLSGELERILPIELVKLLNPITRRLFYVKLVEQGLLSYNLRGKNWVDTPPKKRKRGPVVALVDTSGSMHGAPETLAKALILAITRKMLKEKRAVKVILFSSTNQITEIELSDTKRMEKEFLEFLSLSFGGGTDFNTALNAGLNALENAQYKNADLLFISDGLSVITDNNLLQRLNSWKSENNARVFSIIIGNDKAGGLEQISDYIHLLSLGDKWVASNSPSKIIKLICTKGSKDFEKD